MSLEITPHDYAMSLASRGHTAQSIKQATGVDVGPRLVRSEFKYRTDTVERAPIESFGPPVHTLRMKIAAVIRNVAVDHGVTPEDITGRSNLRIHAYARHEAMYIILRMYGLSLTQIGKALDNRDHSTVQSGIKGHCKRNGLDYVEVRRPTKYWTAPVIPSRPKFDQYYKPRTTQEYVRMVGMYAS